MLVGGQPGSPAPPPIVDLEGDAGLFGPEAACWRVHGDFTTMMIGGIAALLLQMLHPRALAGVWDHSNFRQDRYGRLGRTARFIAGTTYGTTEAALAQIARVKSIHDGVSGVTDQGEAYSANDPDLLTWIHVAEVSSFLKAWIRHRDPAFSGADQDRYYAEVAQIAERLGATDIPRSRAEVDAYLRRMRPELRFDARTRDVAQALVAHPPKGLPGTIFSAVVFDAAWDLLPDWAMALHGAHVSATRRPAIRLGVAGLGRILRWGMSNGAEWRARQRTARLSRQA